MNISNQNQDHATYDLCFQSLFDAGRAYVFPCDAAGHVDIDALSFKARQNYFYAWSVANCRCRPFDRTN